MCGVSVLGKGVVSMGCTAVAWLLRVVVMRERERECVCVFCVLCKCGVHTRFVV